MISVSLLGLGTVGKGVYKELVNNSYVKLNHILVRNVLKHKDIPNITDNVSDIINDNSDVLIEVIGGKTTSLDIIEYYLKKGKCVITANKALLSKKLVYLTQLANEYNGHLYFEASCMGAVPIINYISKSNNFDTFYSLKGIVNGSTNFLLTNVANNVKLNDAIIIAKEKGFLEENPSEDLEGIDAANKLIILSKIAYKADFDNSILYRYPLTKLSDKLIDMANECGKRIKYIAESFMLFNSIYLSVEPCLVKKDDKFYNVSNEFNIIMTRQRLSKEMYLSGKGAGSEPTASAVLFDFSRFMNNDYNNFKFDNKLNEMSLDLIEATYLIDSDIDIGNKNIHKLRNGLFEASISRKELLSLLDKINSYVRII